MNKDFFNVNVGVKKCSECEYYLKCSECAEKAKAINDFAKDVKAKIISMICSPNEFSIADVKECIDSLVCDYERKGWIK